MYNSVCPYILGAENDVGRHPASPRYTSVTLNMLKFIYGDINQQRLQELKEACRKEVTVTVHCWTSVPLIIRQSKGERSSSLT